MEKETLRLEFEAAMERLKNKVLNNMLPSINSAIVTAAKLKLQIEFEFGTQIESVEVEINKPRPEPPSNRTISEGGNSGYKVQN